MAACKQQAAPKRALQPILANAPGTVIGPYPGGMLLDARYKGARFLKKVEMPAANQCGARGLQGPIASCGARAAPAPQAPGANPPEAVAPSGVNSHGAPRFQAPVVPAGMASANGCPPAHQASTQAATAMAAASGVASAGGRSLQVGLQAAHPLGPQAGHQAASPPPVPGRLTSTSTMASAVHRSSSMRPAGGQAPTSPVGTGTMCAALHRSAPHHHLGGQGAMSPERLVGGAPQRSARDQAQVFWTPAAEGTAPAPQAGVPATGLVVSMVPLGTAAASVDRSVSDCQAGTQAPSSPTSSAVASGAGSALIRDAGSQVPAAAAGEVPGAHSALQAISSLAATARMAAPRQGATSVQSALQEKAPSEASTRTADTPAVIASCSETSPQHASTAMLGAPRIMGAHLPFANTAWGSRSASLDSRSKDFFGVRAEMDALRGDANAQRESKTRASFHVRPKGAMLLGTKHTSELAAMDDSASAASTVDPWYPTPSGAPLAAAEAALAAAEAALAKEESSRSLSCRSEVPRNVAEAFQLKLEEIFKCLRAEQRGRELLSCTVTDLDKRLSDGLTSIGDVAAARMATDEATDAMLNALRKCVDELSEQCAWPGAGAAGAVPLAPTLAGAVQLQEAWLRQVVDTQGALQARMEEQESVELQLRALQGEKRQLAEALRAMAEQQQQLRGMQQQLLTCSVGSSAVVAKGTEALEVSVRVIEGQMEQMQGDRSEMAGVLADIRAQQETLQVAQQQQEEVLQSMLAVLQGHSVESAQSESAVKELREEIAAVANSVKALVGRLDEASAEDPKAKLQGDVSKLQTEVGSVAKVVRELVERVSGVDRSHKEPRPRDEQRAAPEAPIPTVLQPAIGRRCMGSAVVPATRALRPSDGKGGSAASGPEYPPPMPEDEPFKAPSPRRWLQEPLSVLVSRYDDGSSEARLQSAPVLGRESVLNRVTR